VIKFLGQQFISRRWCIIASHTMFNDTQFHFHISQNTNGNRGQQLCAKTRVEMRFALSVLCARVFIDKQRDTYMERWRSVNLLRSAFPHFHNDHLCNLLLSKIWHERICNPRAEAPKKLTHLHHGESWTRCHHRWWWWWWEMLSRSHNRQNEAKELGQFIHYIDGGAEKLAVDKFEVLSPFCRCVSQSCALYCALPSWPTTAPAPLCHAWRNDR
jgi:hypothetical protein